MNIYTYAGTDGCIQNIDGDGEHFGLNFADILIFTTGVPTEPPLGFYPALSIRFTEGKLPHANTCANCLHLPLGCITFDEFRQNMCFGILNSAGFGRI